MRAIPQRLVQRYAVGARSPRPPLLRYVPSVAPFFVNSTNVKLCIVNFREYELFIQSIIFVLRRIGPTARIGETSKSRRDADAGGSGTCVLLHGSHGGLPGMGAVAGEDYDTGM
jgi:hypothetical protein